MSRLALVVLLAGMSACATFDNRLAELDSVMRFEESAGAAGPLEYREDPAVRPWLVGSGSPLWWYGELMGVEPVPTEAENPQAFARERIRWLVEEARGDLLRSSLVLRRLLLIADRDDAPLNRIVALDTAAMLCEAVGIDVLAGRMTARDEPGSEQVQRAVRTFQEHGPHQRQGPLAAAHRDTYREALDVLTRTPRQTMRQRRLLVHNLEDAWRLEPDPDLAAATEGTLRRALGWAVQAVLFRSMKGFDGEGALVRREAIRIVHRLGGPPVLPVILAEIEIPSALQAEQGSRFDPDPHVRLELVHLCGQVQGRAALQGHRLPDGTQGPSPAEFLYEQVARQEPRMPGLRRVALEGLALTLGWPLQPDPTWAHDWWVARAEGRGGS